MGNDKSTLGRYNMITRGSGGGIDILVQSVIVYGVPLLYSLISVMIIFILDLDLQGTMMC